jgi:SagB-type dehydrogenase family enzyme
MSNRDIAAALTYHQETKHSYDSVYRNHHFLDWGNQPRPYKLYTNLDSMALPQTWPTPNIPALQALSHTVGAMATLRLPSLTDLAFLLFCAAGVTRRRLFPGQGEVLFRAAACTGALYHIEFYLAVTDLPALPAGLYHFGPVDFALRRLRDGDQRPILVAAAGDDTALQEAPIILIGTDTFWRNAWKYRARAYRHTFWDSGTILANLLAAVNALDLPSQLVAGFADTPVNTLLDLDDAREAAIFLVGLGCGAPVPETARSIEVLHFDTVPLSPEECDYPAIRLMHTASSLDDAQEAAAWKEDAPPLFFPVAANQTFVLTPDTTARLPQTALETVIRRRGSTRRFAHRHLSLTQLSNVLIRATHDIPADFLRTPGTRLNDIYLLVHAVTDLPAGAYLFRVQEESLELLQEGDFRHQAGLLALGQELAADASVNVYFLCDLAPILEHWGNRGYRVAQLEAGILGGRMYLAAYAQGFGATGLTFFDDDVIDVFSPHAAGKSVMFLLAMGYAATRRWP